MAPSAAPISNSGSGARSESTLNTARRTTVRTSSRSSDAASSAATRPRNLRSRVAAARFRRSSPYSGWASRFCPAVDLAERDQATQVGLLDRRRVCDSRRRRHSIGSQTASMSTTSPTAPGTVPILNSINSARLGGTLDPRSTANSHAVVRAGLGHLLLDDIAQIERIAASQLPQAPGGIGSTGPPSVSANSVAVSSADRGCKSRRSNGAPRHTSCTAAGTGSPLRIVNTTFAARRWTI